MIRRIRLQYVIFALAVLGIASMAGQGFAQIHPPGQAVAPAQPHTRQQAEESTDGFWQARDIEIARDFIKTPADNLIAYEVVEDLTTRVGPRLAGTAAEAEARNWAIAYLEGLGITTARIEPFTVPLWQRGAEEARVTAPFMQPIEITTLGGSSATPRRGVQAEIIRFETLAALEDAPLEGFAGKIIFVDQVMSRTQDGSGYGFAVQNRSRTAIEAGRRGAVLALIRSVGTSSHRFAHTGQMRYDPAIRKVPIGAISAPDADQIRRLLARGPVTLSVKLRPSFRGDAPSGNVIADIEGETDELVIIGGHLDSWDLGTGAVDDGAGVGITMAAFKMIHDLVERRGIKPKRTIRLILWGSEEVGIVGAKAYAEKYAQTLNKIHVAAESDFGAGRIWQLETGFAPAHEQKARALARHLAPLGIAPGPLSTNGGPDLRPFREAGVPVVNLKQNGWDYFDLHHTKDDTFDKINKADLDQNTRAWAAFTWLVSEIEGGFRPE